MGILAEMEGFEPPHVLRRLADFESAPFSHLGTSPKTWLLYQRWVEKSRIFPNLRLLFCHLQDLLGLLADLGILLPAVRAQTVGAVFVAILGILEITAAILPKGIQGAVAENTAETFRISTGMAGKIFTFPILEKIIMCHKKPRWICVAFRLRYAIIQEKGV